MRIISKQSSDIISSSLNISKANTEESSVNDEDFTDIDDESVSTDGLEIDITESPKHEEDIDIEDKRVLENIEEEIERQLDEKAAKSNLSATNVKNILKHVITNEHVLAMVRNTTEGNHSGCDFVYEPKLTRAKAKELLKTQSAAAIPWAKPKSEVHILINEELPEDSDDDEYVPHEDEQSEDDKEDKESCNPSDIESQPATPATPAPTHDCSTQTNWTEDGVFKIPQSTNTETNKHTEMIALRTRSKLSLSDTPLEVIEESLIPPDITTDMYDLECDDEDWKDFLKKFTRPLDEAMHGTQEDDDEADPEYNVLADEEIDAVDLEELREDRAVKVTKKELNTLVAELFEFSEMFTNAKDLEKIVQDQVPENNDMNNATQQLELQPTDMDNIQQQDESIVVKDIYIEELVMSNEQFLLFEQQMRQHVQMLTQNYILTYEHPVLSDLANNFKNMLLSFHELAKYNPNSPYNPYNLQMAVDFINDWEKILKDNSAEVQEMKKYVSKVVDKYNESRVKGYEYICTFPQLLMKKVTASSVFLYPSLLPKIPFRCYQANPRATYIHPENELIALGLEQFIPYMENFEAYKTKFKALRLADVAHFISRYMMPHKDAKKLYIHIKAMKDKKVQPNPIGYYFANNKAPTTLHYVVPLLEFGIMPPCMRQADTLPYQWKIFIYPETKLPPPQITLSKVAKPPAYNSKLAKKKKVLIPKGKTIPCNEDQVVIINHEGAFESKIEVRSPQVVIIEKVPVTNVRVEKPTRTKRRPIKKKKLLPKIEEIYLTSPSQDSFLPENITPKADSLSVINKSTDVKTKSHSESAKNTDKALKDTIVSNIPTPDKVLSDTEVSSKHNTSNTNKNTIPSSLLNFKFNSAIFKNLKEDNMLPSMPFLMTPMKDPTVDPESTNPEPQNEKVDKQLSPEIPRIEETENVVDNSDNQNDSKRDDEDELNALMKASSTMQQKRKANASKKAKLMKEYNATLAMLCPEDSSMSEEKAKNYAQAFYDKVQERLENDSPLEYQKFMEVLSEHDETTNSVSELYEKIESVLSPKHSDLCEEFLTFLTPEQAKQIGKLVPHFMLSNMSLFLRKLEIYYCNQPAQLRRIYKSLTELAEITDVTMDEVKATILPLLKGNTLLIDWFLQMFPSEPPPESLKTNWEHISCDDGDDFESDDKVFETINLPEVEDPYGGPNCICKCHNIADEMYASRARHCIPCGTKFLQGRVYVQTGKGLRLANVTFNNSPNTDHNSRLSVKPIMRQKRKSETSPSKILMSPTKDDEPRHSNESEDDVHTETAHSKKIKTLKAFRTNSPSKPRKKPTKISTPKSQKPDCKTKETICKNKTKVDTVSTASSSKKTKLIPNKIVNKSEECGSDNLQEEVVIPDSKSDTETTKNDTSEVNAVKNGQVETEQAKTESEPEAAEWDVKTSPGHSVESMDTCEESSQDTIDGPASESDNDSITEEVESVISENSEDSSSQHEDTLVESEASQSWTRDEDKIILQTFQERGDTPDIFNDIQKALPNRTVTQIRQRFHTLMSLLQEMAAS